MTTGVNISEISKELESINKVISNINNQINHSVQNIKMRTEDIQKISSLNIKQLTEKIKAISTQFKQVVKININKSNVANYSILNIKNSYINYVSSASEEKKGWDWWLKAIAVIADIVSILGLFKGVFSKIGSVIKWGFSKIPRIFSSLKNGVGKVFDQVKHMGSLAKDKVSSVWSGRGQIFDKAGHLGSIVKDKVSNVWSVLRGGVGQIFDKAGHLGSIVKDKASSAWSVLRGGAGQVFDKARHLGSIVKDKVSNVWSGIKNIGGKTLSIFKNSRILGVATKVAPWLFRAGRLFTPIGWASLAAEGIYRGYKSFNDNKVIDGKNRLDTLEGKNIIPNIGPMTMDDRNSYIINSAPVITINVSADTPQSQLNQISHAVSAGVLGGEKELVETINGGLG